MNLNCPKCGSDNTEKLTLVMSRGGTVEKAARLGVSYSSNIVIPLIFFIFAALFGVLFGMMNGFLGLAVFVAIMYGGFVLRKKLQAKTKPKYSDLSDQVKSNGYLCNRCENTFVPAA